LFDRVLAFWVRLRMEWSDRIGRRLRPRDLHVFLAVAEKGNMAKAAEQLAISRPVVSKTIAELEQTLGVRLLDRTPHGVEPTLYGRALLKRSLAVFDELRKSVKEIEFLINPNAGELRIGFSEVPAAGLVPGAIDLLSRQYPNIKIQTEQGTFDTLVERLRARRCEVVVTRLLSREPDITAEPVHYDQLFVVAGVRSKWARRRHIGLADLAEEAWVQAPAEMGQGSPTLEAFRAAGLSAPRVAVLSSSLNLRYGLLATGRFITMIPESVLRHGPQRASIRKLPIKLPRWHVPTCILTLKDRTLSPLAQRFIECLHSLGKPLARGPKAS
jgi:DNA-binding transcriptional LysR family regulator